MNRIYLLVLENFVREMVMVLSLLPKSALKIVLKIVLIGVMSVCKA